MNYLKSALFVIVPFIVLSFIVSILYYFNITSNSIQNIFKVFIPVLSFFLGGLYLVIHSKENGWLEGLKLGGIFIILFFLISYLGFDVVLSFPGTIYYLIILLSSMFGAMFGIRNVIKTVWVMIKRGVFQALFSFFAVLFSKFFFLAFFGILLHIVLWRESDIKCD